jgi:hypothetical protein
MPQGAAIADEYAQENAILVLVARSADKLNKVAACLHSTRARAGACLHRVSLIECQSASSPLAEGSNPPLSNKQPTTTPDGLGLMSVTARTPQNPVLDLPTIRPGPRMVFETSASIRMQKCPLTTLPAA